MWDKIEHRLALMELVVSGRLRRRKSQLQAWSWLAELPWTRRSSRQNEIVTARSDELLRLLNQAWPEWTDARAQLEAAGLSVSESGWRRLQEIQSSRTDIEFPPSLNRKTALAQVGQTSKATLSRIRREALKEVQLRHDGIIRLRPSAGLKVSREGATLDANCVAGMLGELVISERALVSGTSFFGTAPDILLLVENLGAYQDITVPDSWLVAHVPGWDTNTVRLIFDRLASVDVLHFGDLDPNGVRIFYHLRSICPRIGWFVPSFWGEYIEKKGLKAEWPAGFETHHLPRLVQDLVSEGVWLEQEAIILDRRLTDALVNHLEFVV